MLCIAGPCSAENMEQVQRIAAFLAPLPYVHALRFGVWKPRTRPNTFQGIGKKALRWLKDLQVRYEKPIVIEVGSPKHIEEALKLGFQHFWIGARTTVNPFLVQSLADAVQGVSSIEVIVKNPVNPDLGLWIGAIERFLKAGVQHISACHRGFSVYLPGRYRNEPYWELPLKLRQHFPNIPLLCDPSHIAGKRALVLEVAQKAIDLGFDGIMVEVHPNPEEALSDKQQQLTPEDFLHLISQLRIKRRSSSDNRYLQKLKALRAVIDEIDRGLLQLLKKRMEVVCEIGALKDRYQVCYVQWERWEEVRKTRRLWAQEMGLAPEKIEQFLEWLHLFAVEHQREKKS